MDLAYNLRTARIAKQRSFDSEIEKMKSDEEAIREYIIQTFKKSEIEGAKGSVATAGITHTPLPVPKDWPKIYKYIEKNDAWDLMEKRIHKTAFRDRLEAGEVIPGIETFDKLDLSLTKIGGK